jgi:N-acetylglucosaminyl-diphospho-decaprenol L-rhamnosyltransferase
MLCPSFVWGIIHPMSQEDLAIIIVTWNVRELALDCLESVFQELERGGLRGTVWVTDNASADGTAEAIRERFPEVRVLEPGENLGFAGGNNLALRQMGFPDGRDTPPAVLLLNPDTLVRPGALRELLTRGLARPDVGLAGARLVYGDGAFQHSAFGFPGLAQLIIDLFPVPGRLYESRLNGRYPRALYAGKEPFEVDHPLGAAFLVRGEAIRGVGLMDEGYHLYCEEIDWAMRIHAAGWRAVCVPTAEIVHYEGQSTRQARPESIVRLWTARLRLYGRHYGPLRNRIARFVMRAGMRRVIRQTEGSTRLDEAARAALVEAYQTVLDVAR